LPSLLLHGACARIRNRQPLGLRAASVHSPNLAKLCESTHLSGKIPGRRNARSASRRKRLSRHAEDCSLRAVQTEREGIATVYKKRCGVCAGPGISGQSAKRAIREQPDPRSTPHPFSIVQLNRPAHSAAPFKLVRGEWLQNYVFRQIPLLISRIGNKKRRRNGRDYPEWGCRDA